MNDRELVNIYSEKSLGTIIGNNLKMNDQCTTANKKANLTLKLISRDFNHKSPEVVKTLCMEFVTPHF